MMSTNTLEFYQQQLAKSILPGELSLRQKALDKAIQLGWPTHKQEAWKYTRTHLLQQKEFAIANENEAIDQEKIAGLLWPDCYHVVFYQGQYRQDLSELPSEIQVSPMQQMISDNAYLESTLTLLNDALWQSGIQIFIPAHVNVGKPLQIIIVDGKEDASQFLKINIQASQDSEASIILHCVSPNDGVHFTNINIHTNLSERAALNFLKIHDAQHDHYFVHHEVQQASSSTLNIGELSIGNAWLRNEVLIDLQGEDVQSHVFGFYLAKKQEHVDHHIVINHQKPHGTSKQFFKGIAADHAKAVFNGKVKVAQEAQKTDAEQHNQCLLLSSSCEIDTKPELEIYADDVKCAHGAAVGQLPENELFYLMARGISENEAKKMLMQAFAHDVFEKITWLPATLLLNLIDERLSCLM